MHKVHKYAQNQRNEKYSLDLISYATMLKSKTGI